jgi:hypothetical protein
MIVDVDRLLALQRRKRSYEEEVELQLGLCGIPFDPVLRSAWEYARRAATPEMFVDLVRFSLRGSAC